MTEPSSLVVTPYHVPTAEVVFHPVLRVQLAPSVALYKATRASRSTVDVAVAPTAPADVRGGASVPAVATPTNTPGGNEAPATNEVHDDQPAAVRCVHAEKSAVNVPPSKTTSNSPSARYVASATVGSPNSSTPT